MTPLTIAQALIATVVSGMVIFATRALPFVLFSKREPPAIISFVEHSIPPMVMAILVVHCLKDASFDSRTLALFASLAAVVLLHLWRRNPMISIFGGTALYMMLIRVMR